LGREAPAAAGRLAVVGRAARLSLTIRLFVCPFVRLFVEKRLTGLSQFRAHGARPICRPHPARYPLRAAPARPWSVSNLFLACPLESCT